MSAKIVRFVSGAKVFSGGPKKTESSGGARMSEKVIPVVEDPDVVEEARQRDLYRIPHEFEDET